MTWAGFGYEQHGTIKGIHIPTLSFPYLLKSVWVWHRLLLVAAGSNFRHKPRTFSHSIWQRTNGSTQIEQQILLYVVLVGFGANRFIHVNEKGFHSLPTTLLVGIASWLGILAILLSR